MSKANLIIFLLKLHKLRQHIRIKCIQKVLQKKKVKKIFKNHVQRIKSIRMEVYFRYLTKNTRSICFHCKSIKEDQVHNLLMTLKHLNIIFILQQKLHSEQTDQYQTNFQMIKIKICLEKLNGLNIQEDLIFTKASHKDHTQHKYRNQLVLKSQDSSN